MTAWEDQQAQPGPGEWQDGAEIEPAGVPPSPGRSGARWGLQWGTGEDPKPAAATVSLCCVVFVFFSLSPLVVVLRLIRFERIGKTDEYFSGLTMACCGAISTKVPGCWYIGAHTLVDAVVFFG